MTSSEESEKQILREAPRIEPWDSENEALEEMVRIGWKPLWGEEYDE